MSMCMHSLPRAVELFHSLYLYKKEDIMENLEKVENNKLVKTLKSDKELKKDKTKRLAFIAMSRHYVKELQDNIYKSAFDLQAELQGTTVDEWAEFLDYPAVSRYRRRLVNQDTRAKAESQMASGYKAKDALAIKDALDAEEGQGAHHNYIVMMLPERLPYGNKG